MSTKLDADDGTLAARFSKLQTFSDVASLLEITTNQLGFYLYRAKKYKTFQLRKRSGGYRTIVSPVGPFRIIQRKLNQVLRAVYGSRSAVRGFVRDKSIVTNARRHLHKRLVLNFDLQNFFPTIHFGRVKGLFQGKGYMRPEQVAVILAQICCYKGALPIGAPTSPILSNMICAHMDSRLKKLATGSDSTYTRYADDITLSTTHHGFPPAIAYRDSAGKWTISHAVISVVKEEGFEINRAKTRFLPAGYRQEVTGLIVGSRLNVKRTLVRQTRAMLHACETWGIADASREFANKYLRKQTLSGALPDLLKVMRGKIEFIGDVRGRDDTIYIGLIERYLKLDKNARMPCIVATAAAPLQVIQRAIWLLDEDGGPQGTGFALNGFDIVTAFHVLSANMRASCPAVGVRQWSVHEVTKNEHFDVARLSIAGGVTVRLDPGDSGSLKVDDSVRILGFPLHGPGSGVNAQPGRITAQRMWHGVPHFIVDCQILKGNSGGPVLNPQNQVIGVVITGGGDERSGFLPIHIALAHLRDTPDRTTVSFPDPRA